MSALDALWRVLGRRWPPFELPAPSGPHRVGTTWRVVVDASRQERFASEPAAMRELPVRFWYPAAPGAAGTPAPYAAPESLTALLPLGLNQRLLAVRTHAIEGAAMADLVAPVLVFSHGYTGYAEQNTVQMEELASRGYVVASIAHPGEAAWAPFPDGRGVPLAPAVRSRKPRRKGERKGLRADLDAPDASVRRAAFLEYLDTFDEPLRSESVREWARDTRAVVDHLEQLQAGVCASGFQGRLDLSRLGVFGMSYGGATAVEFARTDARCRAAVNLDGACFGGLVTGTLVTPLLIMSSTVDRPVQVPALDRVSGPVHLATVPDTSHGAFTDLPLIFPRWMRRSRLVGRMDALRRESILNDCIAAFFDMHLLQRGSDAFDALPQRYPEVAWASGPTRDVRPPVARGDVAASVAGEVQAVGSRGSL